MPSSYLLVTAVHVPHVNTHRSGGLIPPDLVSLLCQDIAEVFDLPPCVRILAVSLITLPVLTRTTVPPTSKGSV